MKSAISDHFPVFLLYRGVFQENCNASSITNVLKYRTISGQSLQDLYDSLIMFDFSPIYGMADINEAFTFFETKIYEIYDRHCPIRVKTISFKDISKPWIDYEAKQKMKLRDKYLRLYKMGVMDRVTYARLRNEVTSMLRRRRIRYFEEKFEEVKYDMKRTWSVINGIIRPNTKIKKRTINELLNDDVVVNGNVEIANSLNDYFVNVGANIARSFDGHGDHTEFLSGEFTESFFFSPATKEDVDSYIKSLKLKKCSVYSFPASVLKYISYIVEPIICHLIKLICLCLRGSSQID